MLYSVPFKQAFYRLQASTGTGFHRTNEFASNSVGSNNDGAKSTVGVPGGIYKLILGLSLVYEHANENYAACEQMFLHLCDPQLVTYLSIALPLKMAVIWLDSKGHGLL